MKPEKDLNMKEVLDETLNNQSFIDFIDTLTSARMEIENSYTYNIFKTLRLETDETKLHSAFIADLLNPGGFHEQKKTFLKLFLKMICKFEENDKRFDENIIVKVEESIGKIDKDKSEGGRLDILIKGESFIIVIENKIYADDQINQLGRYHDYLEKQSLQVKYLYYLTLFGGDASEKSTGKVELKYKRISYKEDILSWLNKCQDECINDTTKDDQDNKTKHASRLKLAIIQYREIIERLLGSSIIKAIRGDQMNETLLKTENLRTLKILHQNFEAITREIIYKIIQEIIEELFKNKEDIIDVPTSEKNTYIWDSKIDSVFNLRFKISENVLYYGISSIDNSDQHYVELTKKLSEEKAKEKGKTDFLIKWVSGINFSSNGILCSDIGDEKQKIVADCRKIISEIQNTRAQPCD